MKISQIIDKIDENQLFVPTFQREYVWKRKHAKALISSLIKDYPTGTMLTWETNYPPELKGDHKYDPRLGSVKPILDGQLGVTSLYPDDMETCALEAKSGIRPLFTTIPDSNGGKTKKLYLRSGNSSPELPIEEVASYINGRFEVV
ncbi:DUF262 domain-containing protein [Saprospiraceae bacterium]|nr:DUF262 domain-containing protein [Saprospiraceae bacterium]